MEIFTPARLNRHTMYSLIDKVIDEDMHPRSSQVTINFRTLDFIEPTGVTILSNITEWLLKRDVKVSYKYPQQLGSRPALEFLDDSQYFKHYVGEYKRRFASTRPTTIPLELVGYNESYQWFQKTQRWLANRLNVSTGSLTNIKICFEEIFNNINDHSQEHIGCVFAQHFPNKNTISVAISDFGVGIPSKIQEQHPWLSDGEAIKTATEVGFSTKSTPRNRGAGLDTLIYNVVNNNQGSVYIHSNHGILNCNYTNSSVLKTPQDHIGYYPGTLIEIVFKTDTIEYILDEEEDFEW